MALLDHPARPGTRRTSRDSAQIHDPAFKACVARQAQYVFDTFDKFPGTVPSVFIMNYVQAHHLDPGFYDRFFKPGAYLRTHAEHLQRWARRAGGENDRWASTYARGPWTCGSSAREPVRTSCSSQG